MDLNAYHHALNIGLSESEAIRVGEDAWMNRDHDPRRQEDCDGPAYTEFLLDQCAQGNRKLAEEVKDAQSNLSRLQADLDRVRAAGIAICDRWDSPIWGGSAENLRHTGELISALRAALTPKEPTP